MAMHSSRHPRTHLVFFDLEATGLSATDQITQIGAKCGSATYNKYVIPSIPIPKSITTLTGISKIGQQMYYHGKPVEGVSPKAALTTFISFLQSIGGQVILVAHNCFNSDGPMLAALAKKHSMTQQLKGIVVGFSDSLPLLRKSLPANRSTGKGYKLGELAVEFLGSSAGAHDALADATMLEMLMMLDKIPVTADDIINSRQVVDSMKYKPKGRSNSDKPNPRYNNYYYDDHRDDYYDDYCDDYCDGSRSYECF